MLEGFGFGGALLAMFMRVGGGIFTKAADVGADLVGKVEAGIPEDDPRNAATIADNVGDNVGDCAGMAADLFESYAVTLVAALILGQTAFGAKGLLLPLIIGARRHHQLGRRHPDHQAARQPTATAWSRSTAASSSPPTVSLVLVAIAAFTFLPSKFSKLADHEAGATGNPRGHRLRRRPDRHRAGRPDPAAHRLLHRHRPAPGQGRRRHVADRRGHGHPGRHLARPRVGRLLRRADRAAPCSVRSCSAAAASFVALYAVALAGCGLLTTAGVIVAMDTFGPVSDNAQGIAEMSGDIDEKGARVLTDLDAVGNTTKAITKGIAIATAVLAATALFGSFNKAIGDAFDKIQKSATARPRRQADAAVVQPRPVAARTTWSA